MPAAADERCVDANILLLPEIPYASTGVSRRLVSSLTIGGVGSRCVHGHVGMRLWTCGRSSVLTHTCPSAPCLCAFISLDFSKAFDSVRHSTLLFFSDHAHRTVYNGEVSSMKSISASIVQGSSVGPASYAVTAADLRPLHADCLCFASVNAT